MGRSFLHYLAVVLGRALPQTQTTQAERDLLCRFLPGCKRIVEVGVFEGFTTRVLAEACDPDAMIWGVDPFFPGRFGICWGRQIAVRHNRRHLASGRLRLVHARSTEVAHHVPDIVDYVFIDADHSLAAAVADWAFWTRRLARGGIIALHDSLPLPGQHRKARLGSQDYFRLQVRHDGRFRIEAQRDSLSILRKLDAFVPSGNPPPAPPPEGREARERLLLPHPSGE